MNNKFFDDDNAERIREKLKEEREINKQKAKFNKMHEVGGNLEGSGGYNTDNEKLLRAYIGHGYDSIIKRGYNIFALLFGPFYILYRKQYVYGLGLMFFYSFLILFSSVVPNVEIPNMGVIPSLGIVITVFVLIALIVGGTFNNIYVSRSIDNVNRLKKEYIAYNTEDLCRSYGGTSFVMAIIAFIVFAFLIIIAFNTTWIKNLIK